MAFQALTDAQWERGHFSSLSKRWADPERVIIGAEIGNFSTRITGIRNFGPVGI
jgi:hypothetical protein